jgi:hypothetical protein
MTIADKDISKLAFLKRWIDEEGNVDYLGLKNDIWFHEQLTKLKTTNPKKLSHNEEFAFWLNAYNFFTLEGVLKKLEKNPNWKGNTNLLEKARFFYLQRFQVEKQKLSLATIENKILRKKFKDPRIHFAINCASASCPVIPGRIFTADYLDTLLDSLTKNFITNEKHVNYKKEEKAVYLNPIFKWYKKDFDAADGVINFINKYVEEDKAIPNDTEIKYFVYDWTINRQ